MARAIAVPVGRRLGGRLATTLVATINSIIFSLFLFLRCLLFFIEGVLGSKNLFTERFEENKKISLETLIAFRLVPYTCPYCQSQFNTVQTTILHIESSHQALAQSDSIQPELVGESSSAQIVPNHRP